MKDKYKIYKESLEGKILKTVNYVVNEHAGSFGYAAAGLISTGISYYSINEFMNELNGVVPMDPESPMFIPAALGTIFTFGFFANAVRHRVMENKELREAYARYFHKIESERERAAIEAAERAEAERKSEFFRDFAHNQRHIDNLVEEGSHKTR